MSLISTFVTLKLYITFYCWKFTGSTTCKFRIQVNSYITIFMLDVKNLSKSTFGLSDNTVVYQNNYHLSTQGICYIRAISKKYGISKKFVVVVFITKIQTI